MVYQKDEEGPRKAPLSPKRRKGLDNHDTDGLSLSPITARQSRAISNLRERSEHISSGHKFEATRQMAQATTDQVTMAPEMTDLEMILLYSIPTDMDRSTMY